MHKITPIFNAEVKEGQLLMTDDEYHTYRKWLWTRHGKVQFIIKKYFKKRSTPQNAWYWSAIIPMIADEMGEADHNYVHALMKSIHLSKKVSIRNKTYTVVGRTSKLNSSEFGEYCERIRSWASMELGLNIPDPDPDHNARPVLIDEGPTETEKRITPKKPGGLQGKEWNELIDMFEEVNPMYEEFYKNKTERKALDDMVQKFGYDKIKGLLEHLPHIISKPYAPRPTTPVELKKGLGKVIAFHKQEQKKEGKYGGLKIY